PPVAPPARWAGAARRRRDRRPLPGDRRLPCRRHRCASSSRVRAKYRSADDGNRTLRSATWIWRASAIFVTSPRFPRFQSVIPILIGTETRAGVCSRASPRDAPVETLASAACHPFWLSARLAPEHIGQNALGSFRSVSRAHVAMCLLWTFLRHVITSLGR